MKKIVTSNTTTDKSRSIKAASALSETPVMYKSLENEASNDGYDMKCYDDFSFDLIPTENKEFMPEIHVTATKNNNGRYELNAEIPFPTINTEDLQYYDSVYYITQEWERNIGGLFNQILIDTYSNDDYYEEE